MFIETSEAQHKPVPRNWRDDGVNAAWLGHATCLIQLDGFTILTDPVFSQRCGIDLWLTTLGPKRLVQPALAIPELPQIDLVLLSHAHFDHWDLPSLARLAGKQTAVLCAKETSDLLTPPHWKSVEEIAWGEKKRVGPLEITGVEVKHWGARVRSDVHRGYTGFLIEGASGKVLFSGDSAHTDVFKRLRGGREIDLAIMPIGAYRPWIQNHCTPEQAIQMADWAGARQIMPVHHKTFVLSTEPLEEPISRFRDGLKANSARGVATEIGMEWAKA
jgi:L-ascorbate metabolism protein UlaG (beta-lactamase superfamily)